MSLRNDRSIQSAIYIEDWANLNTKFLTSTMDWRKQKEVEGCHDF